MFLITYLVLPFVCSYILARYTPIIPIVDNKAPEKNEITIIIPVVPGTA